MNNNGISVVICTHNGTLRLEPTLKAMFSQNLDATISWEIIVVNNASTDDSVNACEQLNALYNLGSFPFKIIEEKKPGLNNARMCGLYEAAFDWILFCDDDNHMFADYIQIGYNLITTNKRIGVLGGNGIPLFEINAPQWFEKYSHSFAVGSQNNISGKLPDSAAEVYGAGAFYRKQPILNFFDKGFETITTDRKGNSLASGGDVEWCYILQLAGYEVWYDEQLKFYHAMPANRLTWAYYLQLKKGIASSAALLFTYHALLQNTKLDINGFRLTYLREAIIKTLIHLKHFFKPKKNLSPQDDLANVILKSKANSFLSNYSSAMKHFKKIKSYNLNAV